MEPSAVPGVADFLGYAYVLSGRLDDGLSLLEGMIEGSISRGNLQAHAFPTIFLSEGYRLANRMEEAARLGGQALDFARDHKLRPHQAWALRALGEVASHRDPPDTEKAEATYRQALVIGDELGMRPLGAHCHLGLGKLYGRLGKRREAREHLATAATLYREMDMRFWLNQTEAIES